MIFIEQYAFAKTHIFIEALMKIIVKAFGEDAYFFQKTGGHFAISRRRIQRFRSAVSNAGLTVHFKFIAFGVAPKIIMVFQDKNSCIRIYFAVKMSAGKSTDAATDNHEVIIFIGDRVSPLFPHDKRMHIFPRTIVTAAQSGLCWGIIPLI